SARACRRRQVVTRRTAQGLDGSPPHLRLEGGGRAHPGVRESAQPVRSGTAGADDRGKIWHSAPAPQRADEPVVLQTARSVRRRYLAIPRREDPAVAAAADRDRQDRTG